MHTLRITIIVFMVLLSSIVLAGTMGEKSTEPWIVGLGAGPTWAFGNKAQTIELSPDLMKTYTAGQNNQTFASGEVFLAKQLSPFVLFMKHAFVNQFGLSIMGAGNVKLTGDIWEDGDPEFDNYTYWYKINRVYVGVKDRLIMKSGYFLDPYVSASIGASFNRGYNFYTMPKISAEYPPTNFTPYTSTSFSYAIGIGLQKSWTSQLQIAVGYELADWGQTRLNRASDQTLNSGLTLNHLYAQQLGIFLYYLI